MQQHSQTGSQQQRQSGQFGQGMGTRLSEVETPQERTALDGILRAIAVCEWCADQCVQLADPNMIECIRRCEDVSELGETAIVLAPRRSPYAGSVLQTFLQAAQACAQECGQHSHGHCQECAQVLGQVSNDTQQYLSTFGQGAGQQGGQAPGQQGGQAPGQQGGQVSGQQGGQVAGQQGGF